MGDALVFIPMERWSGIQETFKADWPRGIMGFSLLETERTWENHGCGYGFKVYCPFGNVSDGIVGINVKGKFYEIYIQCPKDDTTKLEDAIKQTKLIDWSRSRITVPVAPSHILNMIRRLATHFNKDLIEFPTDGFYLQPETPPFEIILPQGVTFKPLSEDHAEIVESKWPHTYTGAVEYFKLMIRAKSGYGLFENGNLAAWMLITEGGFFNNLYTLEDFRRKGYAELVVKLIVNLLKTENRNVFSFVVEGNTSSYKLFEKLKFSKIDDVYWCSIRDKDGQSSKI